MRNPEKPRPPPSAPRPNGGEPLDEKSCSRIYYYSSPGQIPFEWEAEPGRRKKDQEQSERARQVAPLSPPPIMYSPAISRTSSAASDKWRFPSSSTKQSKGKQQKELVCKFSRAKSARKSNNEDKDEDEEDLQFLRSGSGCYPFTLPRARFWSLRKLRNR